MSQRLSKAIQISHFTEFSDLELPIPLTHIEVVLVSVNGKSYTGWKILATSQPQRVQ